MLRGAFVLAVIVSSAVQVADQWSKAVVLRLGKFRALQGPGLFWIIPVIETIPYWIDTRVLTISFQGPKDPNDACHGRQIAFNPLQPLPCDPVRARARFAPLRAAAALVIVTLGAFTRGFAQSDSAGLHSTLATWADDAWFTILDRDAARGGRLSSDGILQRFLPNIDAFYQINTIRTEFGLLDDLEWSRQTNGVRYAGGSWNSVDLLDGFHLKESAPLAADWAVNVHFDKEDSPQVTRNLIRIGCTRALPNGFFASLEGTLEPAKPSSSLEGGIGWRQPGRTVSFFIGILDVFNNFIYQDLGTVGAVCSGPGFLDKWAA
ncbi:MAG TPA: hypothetical protein VN848_05845 [Gemmatimonadales bacterium]|nr:hypothetical protein [Gemmatimonadales bacterium]